MYTFKVVVVIHLIQFVKGATIFTINKQDIKLLPKLFDTISKYESSENIKFIPNENRSNKREKIHNQILVKRVVPHDEPNTQSKFYKPLLRIHKKHKISDLNEAMAENTASNRVLQEFEDKFDISADENGVNDKKETISEQDVVWNGNENEVKYDYLVFVTKRRDIRDSRERELSLLKEIRKLLKGVKSKSSKLKTYKKFMKPLMRISVRAFEKSGEANDPLAPSQKKLQDPVIPEDKEWMPHYPPWNYWTYKKTVHQDVCPGNQVKVGNMCIWIPPH